MKRLILACAVLLTTLSAPVFATSNVTIKFRGDCNDCAGQVSATLVLKNFVLNGLSPNLADDNLVSFTYDGSNLLAPYTSSAQSYLSGSLTDPASPDPAFAGLAGRFVVNAQFPDGTGRVFFAESHGAWTVYRTIGGAPEDYGGNSVFTLIAGVPEAASWVMFILGFGLIGGTMRRLASASSHPIRCRQLG